MLTLVENGEVYDPAPRGRLSVLAAGGSILKMGAVDRRDLDRLGLEYEALDASGRLVVPGLIDPHEHLRGASGDGGFATEAPRLFLQEIVAAGITTVVGTLGLDTTTTTLAGLLARVKGLRQLGLTAYLWTGGYSVPPATITGTTRDDVLLIEGVLGAGEIAVSDPRSTDPDARELAKVVNEAYVGGRLSGKAGVTHFHVGPRPRRLSLLRAILDDYDTLPESLYPTHVERDEALMEEALELVGRGATVDLDVVEKDLPRWLTFYLDRDGDPGRLTVSSDSFLTGPHNLLAQLRACVREHGRPLEQVLPLATANTARVLKLATKGRLAPGQDADLLVLERGSLEVTDVLARGRPMVRDGRVVVEEGFLQKSDRAIHLVGAKHGE